MQLFIRLAAANQVAENENFVLRSLPGAHNHFAKNPISPERLYRLLNDTYQLENFYSISFIGDDPLHQTDFLADFLPILRKKGLETFVQTEGNPSADFTRLVPLVSRWCIDLKCRVDRHAGRNRRTLEKILEQTNSGNLYFRLAIDADDDPEKILQLLNGLPLDDHTLILQPCAVFPAHISDWDTGTIIDWIQVFKPYFFQVRWIPQVHKLLRIQ